MKNIILKFFYILISSLLINNSFASDHHRKTSPKVVEVEKAIIGDLIQTVRLIGTIKSSNNISLTAQETGVIDKIYVSSGSKVHKNDLIATLNNYKNLLEAENIALSQLNSTQSLYEKNAASKKDLDEKKKTFLSAKTMASKACFRSQVDGVVGIFKQHLGSSINAGEELVDISSKSALHIDFAIPEDILPYIKKGQDIYIKSQKYSLSDLQYSLDPETYMAPARVNFTCENCIIGSYIEVDLVTQIHPQTIIIPFDSIFIKNGKNYVYIIENNKTKEVPITVGLREKEKIEILSGLKENDQVVIKGQSRLSNDLEVRIAK
jgi:membrane fusion protein (multidrug efflux system)